MEPYSATRCGVRAEIGRSKVYLGHRLAGHRRMGRAKEWGLSEGYWVMEDADLLTLRREDLTVVAAFSAHAADPMEVRKAAGEDAEKRECGS